MRKIWCVVFIGVASIAFAQDKPSPSSQTKPTKESPAKPNLVSEQFAKAALHTIIALKDSDGSSAGNEHIKTLLEDVEIGQSTPEETAITENLKLWFGTHDQRLKTFLTWMHFTSCVKDVNDTSPDPARIPCPDVKGRANKESGIERDFVCFDAYRVSLKSFASAIPPDCVDPNSQVGKK